MNIQNLKNYLLGITTDFDEPGKEQKSESAPPFPVLPNDALIIVPVRGTVLFPQNVMPLVIGRKISIDAVQQAVRAEKQIGLLMQLRDTDQDPRPEDLHTSALRRKFYVT